MTDRLVERDYFQSGNLQIKVSLVKHDHIKTICLKHFFDILAGRNLHEIL